MGLIEPYFRKKDAVLEIRSFYILDTDIDRKRFKKALKTEIQRFSSNLGAVGLDLKDGADWLGHVEL